MKSRRWWAGFVLILGVLALSGCIGGWFQRDVKPMLFFGEPVITGNQGEVILSVSAMPDGGLSGIHVDLGGLMYDKSMISDVVVEGLSEFIVVASGSDDGTGKGSFILINIFSGVETGEIAKLTFKASGNVQDGDFVLSKPEIDLVSNLLTPIVEWVLPIYYAR